MSQQFKTAFTRCRQILKTVKNGTGAKFELAFLRYRHNLETTENSTVTKSMQPLQRFDAKEIYLHIHFHHFRFFTRCFLKMRQLELRFQSLWFSKSAGKNCAVFVSAGGSFLTIHQGKRRKSGSLSLLEILHF